MSRRWVAAGGVVAAAAVLCIAAAASTPFTPGAEVTVAAGFLVVLAALPLGRVAGRVPAGGPATRPDDGTRWGWRWAVVVAPLVVALAWELVCFAHGDRAAWPTVSSLLDDVDAAPLGRGTAFAAWLGLGWALVTR